MVKEVSMPSSWLAPLHKHFCRLDAERLTTGKVCLSQRPLVACPLLVLRFVGFASFSLYISKLVRMECAAAADKVCSRQKIGSNASNASYIILARPQERLRDGAWAGY